MLPSMAPVFANPLSVALFDSEILLINLTTYKDYWLSENFTALKTTILLHLWKHFTFASWISTYLPRTDVIA